MAKEYFFFKSATVGKQSVTRQDKMRDLLNCFPGPIADADHALRGGRIHSGEAAEVILRHRAGVAQARQDGELGRRDIGADASLENRRGALMGAAQQVPDLVLEAV